MTLWHRLVKRATALVVRRQPDAAQIEGDVNRILSEMAGHKRGAVARVSIALLWDALRHGAINDLRHGLWIFLREPRFAFSVSLLFGLGIALTALVFAFVDAVLVRPLPHENPGRIVQVWETAEGRPHEGPAPGNVLDWLARNDVFEALSAWMTTRMTLRGGDVAMPVTGAQVTRGFFDVFRAAPMLGRTFADDEFAGSSWNVANRFVGREPVIVLSYRLWRALGSDPAVVGGTLNIDGSAWQILGVMPAEFAVPSSEVAFWTPWDMRTSYSGARFPSGPPRDFRFLRVAARLKPQVSREDAQQRLRAIAAALADQQPSTNRGWSVNVVPYAEELLAARRDDLLLVFAAVTALLLLVCINIAGLAVTRALSRSREFAVRMALGAGRERLILQLFSEAVVIATVSTGIAVLATQWLLTTAIAFAPPDIPRLHEVRFDARVALFAALAAVAVTLSSALLPALRSTRVALAPALRSGSAGSGTRSLRVRRLMVIAEIGGALVLLMAAGLLLRTWTSLRQVDPGFNVDNLLVLRITPDAERYRTGAQGAEYYRRVLHELRQVPAVTSVAAASLLPLSDVGSDFDRPFWREGARPSGGETAEADVRMVTPAYFSTMQRGLMAGREFSDADTRDSKRVVVINERLAREVWPGGDAVGRSLVLDYQGGAYSYEVVGIARDARYRGPRSESRPEIFIPHAQNPYLVMNVVLRTSIDPLAVAQTARAYALRVDPEQPVHSVVTMRELAGQSIAQDRIGAVLLAMFAAAGLIVACTGVYALCAYTVTERQREIAVRLAIGASPRAVRRMIVGEALALATVGVVLGGCVAAGGVQFISASLFGVTPYDPLTLCATVTVLLAVVLGGSWIPARQATRVDPASVTRGTS